MIAFNLILSLLIVGALTAVVRFGHTVGGGQEEQQRVEPVRLPSRPESEREAA